jgi:hypothetical protein
MSARSGEGLFLSLRLTVLPSIHIATATTIVQSAHNTLIEINAVVMIFAENSPSLSGPPVAFSGP